MPIAGHKTDDEILVMFWITMLIKECLEGLL